MRDIVGKKYITGIGLGIAKRLDKITAIKNYQFKDVQIEG